MAKSSQTGTNSKFTWNSAGRSGLGTLSFGSLSATENRPISQTPAVGRISRLSWITIVAVGVASVAVALLLAYAVIRLLSRREPYSSFARLGWRAKIAFFRLLFFDNRVPWAARVLLVVVIVYLISPIDLIPGVPLDDVALALVCLVAIVKMTPRDVVSDLIRAADQSAGPK